MNRLTSFALGAGLALGSISLAHAADVPGGAWKFSVGVNDTPCTLTLSPDTNGAGGTIAPGSDCPGGLNSVASFRMSGDSIQLMSGSGDLVAWLKPKDGGYVGTRVSDGRKVALTR